MNQQQTGAISPIDLLWSWMDMPGVLKMHIEQNCVQNVLNAKSVLMMHIEQCADCSECLFTMSYRIRKQALKLQNRTDIISPREGRWNELEGHFWRSQKPSSGWERKWNNHILFTGFGVQGLFKCVVKCLMFGVSWTWLDICFKFIMFIVYYLPIWSSLSS